VPALAKSIAVSNSKHDTQSDIVAEHDSFADCEPITFSDDQRHSVADAKSFAIGDGEYDTQSDIVGEHESFSDSE
jgi:hypothetical protein